VLSKTFSSKKDKVRIGRLGYFITNTFLGVRIVKYRRLRCAGHVARIESQGRHTEF
jgi:hypothetical protein